ncbi:hypothetical protein Q3G72_030138 [Acer saccharum]|nr:hypothetical protein Q3G72_030138 [Acer saccharum]
MAEAESRWDELIRSILSRSFSNEVVVDILSKLPVKSLICFKSVCKPWRAMFGDPKFIEMHLSNGISNKRESYLLRILPFNDEDGSSLSTDSDDGSDFGMLPLPDQTSVNTSPGYDFDFNEDEVEEIYSLRDKKSFDEIGKLEVPIQSKSLYYLMVESMNGVVCLIETDDDEGWYPTVNMFLWNPATREFKTLPKPYINRFTGPVRVAAVGFAFHPKINDYKVVTIVHSVEINSLKVEVFSLKEDCWRNVGAEIMQVGAPRMTLSFQDYLSSAFVNGALHWTMCKKDGYFFSENYILSFDVCTDKFNKMKLPFPYVGYELLVYQAPKTFEGPLALIAYNSIENCDIWLMKEYGVVESWVRQYSIRGWVWSVMPFGFFDDGNLIIELSIDRHLFSYDLDVECMRYLEVFGHIRIVKYIESLVPLKSDSRLNWYPSINPL